MISRGIFQVWIKYNFSITMEIKTFQCNIISLFYKKEVFLSLGLEPLIGTKDLPLDLYFSKFMSGENKCHIIIDVLFR